MIKIHLELDSCILLTKVVVDIAIPYNLLNAQEKYKVLWCFHCSLEDGKFFFTKLHLTNYVDTHSFVFVAPSLQNNFFCNNSESKCEDFLSQELIPILRQTLPLCIEPENNYLLGFSMGAFGAWNFSTKHQNIFSKVALVSGFYDYKQPLDPRFSPKNKEQRNLYLVHKMLLPIINKVFFDNNGNVFPKYDVDHILDNYDVKADQKYFIYVGNRDYFSYTQSYSLYKKLKDRTIPVILRESEGIHDTNYWNSILDTIVDDLIKG